MNNQPQKLAEDFCKLCEKRDTPLAQLMELVDQGLDINWKHRTSGWGSTEWGPLSCALYYNREYELIEKLINIGGSFESRYYSSPWKGHTVDQTGFQMAIKRVIEGKDLKLLKLCQKHGLEGKHLNEPIRSGGESMRTDWSATEYLIHKVVRNGNLELVKVFCEAGADVNVMEKDWMCNERGARTDSCFSILYVALEQLFKLKNETYYEIAEYLGERGASINEVSHYLHQYPNPEFEALTPEQQQHAMHADPRCGEFIPSIRYMKVEVLPIDVAISHQRYDFVRKSLEKWNSNFPKRPAYAFVQPVVEWSKETELISKDATYCILSFLGGKIDPWEFKQFQAGKRIGAEDC